MVAGTGTGIGKTHFSVALLGALRRVGNVAVGFKPIETGVADATQSDAARLAEASSFHVKQPGLAFAEPVSPHLAARNAGRPIDTGAVLDAVAALRSRADAVVVELAGGLFTPLSEAAVNADLARALDPDCLILLAPDRLGVLHDVLATSRAARALPLRLDAVVLVRPEVSDTSTGRNSPELQRWMGHATIVTEIPRAETDALAECAALARIAALVNRKGPSR